MRSSCRAARTRLIRLASSTPRSSTRSKFPRRAWSTRPRSTRFRPCRATRKSRRSRPSRKPVPLRKRQPPRRPKLKPPTRPRPQKMKRPARPRTASSLPPTPTKARKAKMKVKVQTLDAGKGGDIELNDEIFAVEPRADILHRVVTWQLEKRRGTARAARERSDVARTGKKFGRQKGGGTARHGDRRAPIFVGGGKAHGPRVRDFNPSLNKKIRVLGLKMALSSKAKDGNLFVVDNLDVKDGKTKELREKLGKLGFGKTALVIDGDALNVGFARASSNLETINLLSAVGANVYDIMRHETLVLTRAAVEKLEARFNG